MNMTRLKPTEFARLGAFCPYFFLLDSDCFCYLEKASSVKCTIFFLLRVFFAAVIGRENGLHMYAGLWRYVGMYLQVAALYQLTKISTHVPNTCIPAPHPSSKKAKKIQKNIRYCNIFFPFLVRFFWIAAARLGVQWRNVECTVIRPCMCAGWNKIQCRGWIMCFFGSPS